MSFSISNDKLGLPSTLSKRKRLRLFKAEMGTLARDDFYEAPAANFHGLKTGGSNDKVTAALL